MTVAPIPEHDEFSHRHWAQPGFEELQKIGKCGEVQNNGDRCKAPVVEWFDLDPDRPYPLGPRIGACGTHQRHVGPRVTKLRDDVQERRINSYLIQETYRIIRALHGIGIKAKPEERGYRQNREVKVFLNNPAEFLHAMEKLGVLEKLGIDMNAARCKSVGNRWSREIKCMEFEGHYPAMKHSDWEGFEWVDPEPEPVPESVPEPDSGGQF